MNRLVVSHFGRICISLFYLVTEKWVWSQREFGLENYIDIRESNTFVDKTLLIKEIFRNNRLLLITAPRHFGKSVNFEMLNAFLRNDHNQSRTYKQFQDTKIWVENDFVNEHMNSYPVLFCNFDSGLEVMCEETLLGYYRQILYGIFIEHDYLKVSPALDDNQRELFTSYIDENEDLEKWKVQEGLKFLTECLHMHHAKKVIVLIDEQDAVVVNAIFREENATITNDSEYFKITSKILNFQNNLLRTTLEDNKHIERAILTGTLPLDFMEGRSSRLSKLKQVRFTQNRDFIKYYGFTQKEVKVLLKRFNLTNSEEAEVQKWYDGYSGERGKVRLVNPWAVTKFLEHSLAYDYWVRLCPIADILLPLMDNRQIQETMVKLVQQSGEVSIRLKKTFLLKDLENLKKTVNKRWDDKTDLDLFYQFLLHIGYLSFDKPHKHVPKKSVSVKVPNREIHQELAKIVKEYFSKIRE